MEAQTQVEIVATCHHHYVFVEPLPPKRPHVYLEKLRRIFCRHQRVLSVDLDLFSNGIEDDDEEQEDEIDEDI